MSSANTPNGSLGRSRLSPPQTMTMDPSVHPKETKWIVMASYPRDCFQKTMKNIDVSQSVFLPRTKFGNMCSYPSLCVNTFHPISVMHKKCRSGGGGNVRVPDLMCLETFPRQHDADVDANFTKTSVLEHASFNIMSYLTTCPTLVLSQPFQTSPVAVQEFKACPVAVRDEPLKHAWATFAVPASACNSTNSCISRNQLLPSNNKSPSLLALTFFSTITASIAAFCSVSTCLPNRVVLVIAAISATSAKYTRLSL